MKHLCLICAIVGWSICTPTARAQPAEVKRVVRTFDFEERRLGNPEELPMHWTKVQGPGMPHYVNGRLSTDLAHGGKYSFRLDLNGGSLAYRYAPDRIRVMPGAHYRVDAMVRTTVLTSARARLSAYFVDLDGHPLLKSVHHTEPYVAKSADDDWQRIGVELSADDEKAAFLVLEVGLLQPALYAAQTLGQRTLNTQDIRGTAWFDDITVSQIPRVTMTTARPGNIFKRGDPVRLVVQIDDRFTDDLVAQLIVRDADGKGVYQRSGTQELGSAEKVGPGRKRLMIEVPELPAGFYRVSLEMSSQGQPLGGQGLSIIQLADANPPTRPDRRFGLIATSLPFEGWDILPQLLPAMSVGRVKLALWSKQGDILESDPGKFDALLEKFQALGIAPTACLLDLPPALARKLGAAEAVVGAGDLRTGSPDDTAAAAKRAENALAWPLLLRADPKEWQPQLAFLVSRHANHLDRWQIGEDGSEAFVTDPKLRKVYDEVYGQFRKLVQRPDLAMPWPAWYEQMPQGPASVALAIPAALVLPSQVPLYLTEPSVAAKSPGGRGDGTSVSLFWLDRDRYGRREQLRDLAQRIIFAMSADATRIDLPLPMSVRLERDVLVQEPTEELLVLRTIITTLNNAAYKGRVPIAEGIEAFLFDRGGQGVLVLWDRGNQAGQRELQVNLGQKPVMIDLWGNVTPLQKAGGKEGRVVLSVSRMPRFLVDIDGQLMQTRASVAFDRPLIESSFQPHQRKLRFTNAYRTAIGGSVKLKPPAGWGITPSTFNFTLNPGETFDKEVTLELPYNSLAGPKTIDAQFILQADGNANFTVPLTVNLGLSDVGMQTLALRDGNDVIVQQMITNYGDKPLHYTAFAVYPGQSRQERLVSGLAPGKTTVKRYKFVAVEFKEGGKLRTGVKEMDGMRILNEETEIQ